MHLQSIEGSSPVDPAMGWDKKVMAALPHQACSQVVEADRWTDTPNAYNKQWRAGLGVVGTQEEASPSRGWGKEGAGF